MSVIAYANGWTMWCYTDRAVSIDEVETPGFFDKIYTLMNVGDIVYCVCKDTVKQLWVKTIKPVTLEDMGE